MSNLLAERGPIHVRVGATIIVEGAAPSYDGRIYFSLAGDRDTLPDLDELATALQEALREQPVPRKKPAPKRRRTAKKPRQ
jgi:hypothetical protein